MLFKNPVRTSKRTPHFTITKINWLTLFKFNSELLQSPYLCVQRQALTRIFLIQDCRVCWRHYLLLNVLYISLFSHQNRRTQINTSPRLVYLCSHVTLPCTAIWRWAQCRTSFVCRMTQQRDVNERLVFLRTGRLDNVG
jgi:hypothetical protein